jgi:type VI protein secretion system component VasF
MRVPVWIKPGVWGAVIGAVAIMIVGFSWMGWTLDSTAQKVPQP